MTPTEQIGGFCFENIERVSGEIGKEKESSL